MVRNDYGIPQTWDDIFKKDMKKDSHEYVKKR